MRTIPVEWKGRQVEAAWPEPIARAGFELSEPTIRATARAAAAVEAAGSAGAAASEVAARLLLRAEGLSSSMIEGIAVTPIELAVGEADPAHVEGPAAWVAANLHVVDDALAETGALTPRKLLGWHRRLMTGAPTIDARHVGAWRDTLVWVGGANPLVAAHVGTPAELVPESMADLIAFANRTDLDPITLAAVAHAHFETIHPFADGNGRIGRVLVSRTLAHGVGVATPPPVSVRFARDIGGYLSGLAMYQQGLVDPWVRWFAECVTAAATGAADTFAAVEHLREDWAERCAGIRPDSVVWMVLDLVGTHPVLSATRVAALTGVSERTARTALAELAARGVLTEVDAPRAGRGRPTRWWVAADLLALAGG